MLSTYLQVWAKYSPYRDSMAIGRPFYVVKEFGEYVPRLVLLDNGQLAVANYCKYGEYTINNDAFKLVGVGCVHDRLESGVKFDNISHLKAKMDRYEELLLRKQSHILIRTTVSIGTDNFVHKYVSEEEVRELLR